MVKGLSKSHSFDCQWLKYSKAPKFIKNVSLVYREASNENRTLADSSSEKSPGQYFRRSSSVSVHAMITDNL